MSTYAATSTVAASTTAVLALALLGGAPAHAAAAPAAHIVAVRQHVALPLATSQTAIDQAAARILADTNAARAKAGLAPLRLSAPVGGVAQDWTERMASTKTMSHNPDYSRQMPSGWTRAAENVAHGYSPSAVVTAWMSSAGHRANILGDFTHIGIGYAVDANGRTWFTQNFGKYKTLAAPSPTPLPAPAPAPVPQPAPAPAPKPAPAPAPAPVPAAPAFSAAANTITIPSTTGVVYYISGAKKAAGTHRNAGRGTVTAKAASGSYKLTGTTSWKFDNRNAVTPTRPTFSASKNTVKIPARAGVVYYVNGTKKKAGTYKYKNGIKLTVTTKPSSGSYRLAGTQKWSVRI